MEWMTSAEGWIALLTLTLLEIVLGIDNIVFISMKGYIYFAMAFSVFVEMINLRVRARTPPIHLHQRYTE